MSIFSHKLRRSGESRVRAPKGFTLVELLAVTVIITIITLVLLLRQSTFDSTTILRSLAYSVALSVRQAQVYGVSVLGSQSGGGTQYAPAYGLYFDRTTPNSYILFADFNNNGVYDAASETVKVFSVSTGYTISELCVKLPLGTNRCTGSDDSTGTKTINNISILFRRPNPDAVFGSSITTEKNYISAWIQIKSAAGSPRSVLVTTPGQITVQPPATLP